MSLSKQINKYLHSTDKGEQFVSRKNGSKEYHILLFGETGSGKTTLINYVTNYFRQGSLEKLKIAIPTKHLPDTEGFKSREKDLHDPKKSKTTECYAYDFRWQNDDVVFRFIDTPGLSDTEGVKNDDLHLDKIMTAAEKSERLAAIVIVINGTVARATANLQNTLVRMKGSLPDTLLNNLVVVLTNCTESSANFDMSSLHPWRVPDENVFYMQNSALSKSPREWLDNPKMLSQMQREWLDSMEEIQRMVQRFQELGMVGTQAFRVMREKREKIKAKVAEILLEVKKLQKVQDELESVEKAQAGVQMDIEKYSNFKTNREVPYIDMKDTDAYNTLCMKHTDKICHKECQLDYTPKVGDCIFQRCACMSGGTNCLTCECNHANHYHAKKEPVQATKTVEDILHDVKASYDVSVDRQNEMKNRITTLHADLQSLKNALKIKEDEIKRCCIALKQICSQFNFVAELKSVVDTMEANKSVLTCMHARSEADTMIRNIKRLADDLSS